MMNFLQRAFDRLREIYGPRHFLALLVLVVIISAAGLAVGVKYNKYIRKAPEYCNNCHLMKEAFAGWRSSDHKSVTCQDCHRLGVVEQNVLLVKYIVYGPEKVPQKHGKKLPWQSCSECHWEQSSQGLDKPEQSYGHYRHNFVECFNCHPFAGHNFPFQAGACARCHQGRHVHGQGMEEVPCVACHIFSLREGTEKNRVIPTRQRCMKCHANLQDASFPPTAPMAGLECFECHDPHGEIKPNDAVCVACHRKDLENRGHGAHKAPCATCHKAHLWRVASPERLCGSCHGPRPLDSFRK